MTQPMTATNANDGTAAVHPEPVRYGTAGRMQAARAAVPLASAGQMPACSSDSHAPGGHADQFGEACAEGGAEHGVRLAGEADQQAEDDGDAVSRAEGDRGAEPCELRHP